MIEITVNVKGLEGLVEVLKGFMGNQKSLPETAISPVLVEAPITQPIQEQAYQVPPLTVPTLQPYQSPVQHPTPNPAQSLPTETLSYTVEQLAVAATQLTDAGRRDEIIQLLGKYGARSLMELPKEAFGAFATDLRGLGAKL